MYNVSDSIFSENNPNGFCIKTTSLANDYSDGDGQLINQHARIYDKLFDVLQLINKCSSIQVTQSFIKSPIKLEIIKYNCEMNY